jgi:4-diphosphocytidyl-2-C-methyl-D-erythritol kinase
VSDRGRFQMLAPAKLNLCLYLGPQRDDGMHLISSVFQPIDLCDRILISEVDSGDQVICPGVSGEDLAARTLRLLREADLDLPDLRIEIEKRIPLAAGMGGGSADAAAVLRYARDRLGEEALSTLRRVSLEVGSDVLAQSGLWSESGQGAEAQRSLVEGVGDQVSAAPPGDTFAVVLLTSDEGLSTPEVYAEADRIGAGRTGPEIAGVAESLRFGSSGLPLTPVEAMVNDLQAAAVSLRPELEGSLSSLRRVGAVHAMVTGSGPTVFGSFATRADAERAAASLAEGGRTGVIVAGPFDPSTDRGVGL